MDYLAKTAAGWWRDFLIAAMFFTRLPLPSTHIDADEPPSLGAAARAFPLAGLLIGALGALALMIASKFGWHPVVAVLIALGAVALITGALHEDGLADVADGFGGGRDREGKLAIMRDSRIGSFGVMALIFSVGIRAGTLASFFGPGTAALALIAAHVLSRATLPAAGRRADRRHPRRRHRLPDHRLRRRSRRRRRRRSGRADRRPDRAAPDRRTDRRRSGRDPTGGGNRRDPGRRLGLGMSMPG